MANRSPDIIASSSEGCNNVRNGDECNINLHYNTNGILGLSFVMKSDPGIYRDFVSDGFGKCTVSDQAINSACTVSFSYNKSCSGSCYGHHMRVSFILGDVESNYVVVGD